MGWRRRAGTHGEPASEGLLVGDPDGDLFHAVPDAVVESIRYLVARVQLNDPTDLPVRLALTSACAGEGVSYVARTLAAVIAGDLRRRVCLVDLDWWSAGPDGRSTGPRADGSDEGTVAASGEEGRGLSDVVMGRSVLDDVVRPTTAPGLFVVAAGRVEPAHRAALVRSGDLRQAIDALVDRFDHVLLELPPVLGTADALTLVRLCDTYLFVVHQGVTPERSVRVALGQLSGAICMGVVLNRASSSVPRALAGLMSG